MNRVYSEGEAALRAALLEHIAPDGPIVAFSKPKPPCSDAELLLAEADMLIAKAELLLAKAELLRLFGGRPG